MRNLTRYMALGAIGVAATACQGGGASLPQQEAISGCGGFEAQARTAQKASAEYCDAEVLLWSYDSETSTLSLADNRIFLNCCGDHGMVVSEEDGIMVITETDAPEFGDARCGCMCVFDFTVEVQDVAMGVIDFELVRDVTDSETGPQVVLTGSIDLAEGSGSLIVDETDVEPWCSGEGT